MTALALALSFLGVLALVGFVLWLRHDTDKRGLALQCERLMDRVLDLTNRLEETRADLHDKAESLAQAQATTAGKLEALKGVHNTSLAETGKALADLVGRVRGCELKAGIRGIQHRPEGPNGLPVDPQA